MLSKLISLLLLLLLSPIFIIVMLLIVIDDGFPIFFKQKRIGLNDSKFWIYKFRTMKNNTPDIPTHLLSESRHAYTKFGPFLRKYSIDELPQFLNIFFGDMVFIGPRPALYNQNDLILLRKKKGVNKIKPGITGWAQVNGRDQISIEEKVELDYYFLKNSTLMLKIKIIYISILKIINAENVSH